MFKLRRKDNGELSEGKERVGTILDSIDDNFFSVDEHWRFRYLNKRAQEMVKSLGKDPARLIGKILWEEFPTAPSGENLRRVMSERKAITDEFYFPSLGQWVESHMYPTADGGLVIFQRYITERKLAEEKLQRSEACLAEGQRLSHTGSWVWNVSTGDLFWSLEHFRIYGVDPEKVKPSYPLVLLCAHPEDRSSLHEVFEQAVRKKTSYEVRFRIVRPDGTIRHVHSLAHPSLDELGNLVEYVGTIIDETDRIADQEALYKAHADLTQVTRLSTMGELAASLAHELNQSLTAIITNGGACLRWLNRTQPDIDEAINSVQSIIGAAKRAGEVVAHTRALLKKPVGERVPVDTTEMVREVLVLVHAERTRHRIVLQDLLAEDHLLVVGARSQLQQVVLNLVLNAIEAMKDVLNRPRNLTVRSEAIAFEDGTGIRVVVQDVGIGVAADKFDRIFEPFYSTKADGLGLGLSISRSIIEGHGGRLFATRNTGPGMTFEFTLPAHTADPSFRPKP